MNALLSNVSLEVLPRATRPEIAALRQQLAPETDLYITFIAGKDPRHSVEAIRKVGEAGFRAVPHVAARAFESRRALEAFLKSAAEAGARRALLIAGDFDAPRGPFSSTSELLATDLLQASGFDAVGFAGYPEGHPVISEAVLTSALIDKLAAAARKGLSAWIVSQLCFEAQPILAWLDRLTALGVDAPVRIGLAGPADLATLSRFAVRCGVGPSVRALRRRGAMWGRLLASRGPDALVRDLGAGLRARKHARVEGLHLFPFGGLDKASAWIAKQKSRLPGEC